MDIKTNGNLKQARHLLIVDDEENILQSLRRLLRRDGYVIHLAGGGEAGLEVLAKEPIGVIVSDQRMPGMTGSEFLSRVKEQWPNTVRIVLSGYTELNSITEAINNGAIYKFLTKPWDDNQLREHIAEAFSRHEMKNENQNLAMLNRAMVDAIPDALLLVDGASQNVLACNTTAEKLLGIAETDLIGRNICDIEPLPMDQIYWQEISSGPFRPLVGVETEFQCNDGSFVPVAKTTSLAAQGESRSVLVLAHDLSRERHIESALERLNAEMASVFEATSEGLLVLDDSHRLIRMNRRLDEIWQFPPAIIGDGSGDAILKFVADQSAAPEQTYAELQLHFETPESRSSGYFSRQSGDQIRWFGNPQILNDEVIGHVFCFSVLVSPEIWSSTD
jgi:PAS domain S-box-containing protein